MRANLDGRPLAAHRPPRFFRKDGELPEVVTLRCVRAPGFEHLGHSEWRTLLGERIRGVEQAAAKQRHTEGRRILGRAEVLRQRPADRPVSREPRRQLAPRVASTNKWARVEALQRNKRFIATYRAARDLWQAGLDAVFPVGTYWLRRFAGVPVEPRPA